MALASGSDVAAQVNIEFPGEVDEADAATARYRDERIGLCSITCKLPCFKAKDGSDDPPGPGRNGERNFHGEKRSNATHASTTDPEAQLYKKGPGKEAKLSFMSHTLMETRNRLIVAAALTKATGTAERKAAEEMIVRRSPGVRRLTLGGDKGYDAASFVADMRALT